MSGPIGQPLVHLWHWKQALTGVPLRRSTSSRKPVLPKVKFVVPSGHHVFMVAAPRHSG